MRICILHRYPLQDIKMTNAAIGYILSPEIKDVLTFKKFNRLNDKWKFIKSLIWIFYAPLMIFFHKRYDVIYCDDSFPFYAALVKMVSPRSKVVIRLGDLHLHYYCKGTLFKILFWLQRREWDIADAIFPISQTMADYVKTFTKTKCVTILDPVDPKDFEYNGDIKKSPKHVIMTHGLITKNKNLDRLLDAVRGLSEVIVWIVGDGPDRERLEKIAPSNVVFSGWMPFDHIPGLIAHCDMGIALREKNPGNEYVVTSPFLQYSIMGKPCLVTDRKVFRDMNYPWIFKEDLTAAILLMLGFLKEKGESEGKKWRKYIMKNHKARDIGKRILWELKQV